ncbi:MAG: hypothetical protein ABWK00_07175 [Desulfurococcaceae archaeon]
MRYPTNGSINARPNRNSRYGRIGRTIKSMLYCGGTPRIDVIMRKG